MVTESIAVNRIEWIKDVRKLMLEFLECYYQGQDKHKLIMCRTRIDLYTRFNDPAYESLNIQLDICMNNEFSMENYNKLLVECQNVLNAVWKRMKLEAGVDPKHEVMKQNEQFDISMR